jgi:hypothetical protein
MRHHEGKFIRIWYELSGRMARIMSIEPYPETYLRSGADHLVEDIRDLITALISSGVTEIRATPDRSATRITLEEAGFRGAFDDLVYTPNTKAAAPVLDEGRPGAFGPDTPILLETGAQTPAGSLYPGVRLAEGGRVEEVMIAQLRNVCRLNGSLFGPMNRLITPEGPVQLSDLPGVITEAGQGTEMVWLVTERSRVRSGTLLFEDMWGSARLRQTRRISQAEVIAALNAEERPDGES